MHKVLKVTLWIGLALLGLQCRADEPRGKPVEAGTQPAAPARRDPWQWPFATSSIWNTPIGAEAICKPAGFEVKGATINSDDEYHIRLKPSDPVKDIRAPSGWGKRWPGSRVVGRMPVPEDLVIPDAARFYTPNHCAAFLMPDGRTVRQLEPATRCERGAHIVGYPAPDQDLYGPGIRGSHFGSGMSSLGGSIRKGEMLRPEPLRHTLKLNIWAKKYCYYGPDLQGFRWPAANADSYAAREYGGREPALCMGALLALQPGETEAGLGLRTEPGKKIFHALQDYGAYVVDDTAGNYYAFSMETGAAGEMNQAFGSKFGGSDRNDPLTDDLCKIIERLCVVDNNAPDRIGGGGAPRAPRAPEITPP